MSPFSDDYVQVTFETRPVGLFVVIGVDTVSAISSELRSDLALEMRAECVSFADGLI